MNGSRRLDPDTYQQHWLHTDQSDWPETNCYVDVWIELLHVLGHDPLAALGFTLRTDLEADQWTFYKYRHHDLEQLYGVEVIELNPWTTVIDQVGAEVRAGRPVLVEVDSWFLPDTAATAYKLKHVKSTIAVLELDVNNEVLVYAHNHSVHRAEGTDFRGVFGLDGAAVLPPYIETVRVDRFPQISLDAQVAYASSVLRDHLQRAPSVNPFRRYQARFQSDLQRLADRGVEFFHDYAFSSYRQFGSSFYLAACHLDWLLCNTEVAGFAPEHLTRSADCFRGISASARALQMRSARTATTAKMIDASTTLQSLIDNYDQGMHELRVAVGDS